MNIRKSWIQSATVWLNSIIATLTALIEGANEISPFITDPTLHAKILAWVGIATAILNVIIRVYKTNVPIAAPDPVTGEKP